MSGSGRIYCEGHQPPTYRRGYKYIYKPEHPRADKGGYVAEHVLVMEQKLGRPLKRGEVVHHMSGDRADNRPENLRLFASASEHLQHHRKQRRKVVRLGLKSITEGEWIEAWLNDRAHSGYRSCPEFFKGRGYDPRVAKEAARIVAYADYQLVRKTPRSSIGIKPWWSWSKESFDSQVKRFFKESIPTYVAFVQDVVAHWEKPGRSK